MKRIITFLFIAAFSLGGTLSAHAESNIDIKVQGEWDFVFGWAQNMQHFKKDGRWGKENRGDDNGIAAQRMRTQINFIASENLQGVLQFEIGETHWGHGGSVGSEAGGKVGADGVNVKTKHAYLDWMVPSTDLHIRMGLQALALPMATELGNPIFDDDVAGIVASYAFDDTFSLTAFWIRPYNDYLNDKDSGWNNPHINDEVDAFGLIAPITLDGVTITPWGMWANIGDGSSFYSDMVGLDTDEERYVGRDNERTTAWWAGLGVAVDLWDPLTFAIDAMYGHLQPTHLALQEGNFDTRPSNDAYNRVGAEGWFVAATLNYKLDWGTPGLFGWWASGDDYSDVEKDGMLGRIPVLPSSNGFAPTTFGFDGAWGIASGNALGMTGTGTWGAGIQVAEMSFIEDLTHTIRFAYIQGTNDSKIVKRGRHERIAFADDFYLTDKDHAFEINFDHQYQIYENLAAVLELGYINLDLDKNTWKHRDGVNNNYGHKTDDAWKAQLSFQYTF